MEKKITLLGIDSNAKSVKGQKLNYMTGMQYLSPARESGVMNTCNWASPGCTKACLYKSGHAAIPRRDGSNPVIEARVRRTVFLFTDRMAYMAQLRSEIAALVKKATRKGFTPCIRLNGTSDLPFHSAAFTGGIMQDFPDLQFYDYTKNFKKAWDFARGNFGIPKNYHVTFSWTEEEENHKNAELLLKAGGNVAVVFSGKPFPKTFLGYPVIDGDENDLRFLDKDENGNTGGLIVALKAKGLAKKEEAKENGFVVQV